MTAASGSIASAAGDLMNARPPASPANPPASAPAPKPMASAPGCTTVETAAPSGSKRRSGSFSPRAGGNGSGRVIAE